MNNINVKNGFSILTPPDNDKLEITLLGHLFYSDLEEIYDRSDANRVLAHYKFVQRRPDHKWHICVIRNICA